MEDGAKDGGLDRAERQAQLELDLRAARLYASLRPEEQALLDRLSRHHAYSARHSLRVAVLAEGMAHALGLEPARVRAQAALHDVGKAEVPLAVLKAPRGLAPEEAEVMRAHAVRGEEILRRQGLDDEALVARSHHERFDGGGYPDGLAAQDIPLAARLVSVCDVWEAMTAVERSWRRPLQLLEALAEVRREAGSQLDSALVEPFALALAALDAELAAHVELSARPGLGPLESCRAPAAGPESPGRLGL